MPEEPPRFYFVHSYHLKADIEQDIIARTSYGYEFTVALEHDYLISAECPL